MARKVIQMVDESAEQLKYSERLRERLLDELKKPSQGGEPIILERIDPEGGHSIDVIWSEWEDIDDAVRAKITSESFEGSVDDVAELADIVHLGSWTPSEAIRMGLMPYRVHATAKGIYDMRTEKALAELKESLPVLPFGSDVFCADEGDAQGALAFLREKAENGQWELEFQSQ
ncbi:hypothetical protein [Stratiformator vulcanicus]|uniref:Uncharacterized protein n=1 Tax=Stratiformator vulcanicus TaxID=2527980 RepID=A0A517R698_9PLAN|nr:hypothetical protein [Stratiformator vulcanicus]QDT39416.1 hypothetical protein Pan189_38230 [Stratiformator vulcanicus]